MVSLCRRTPGFVFGFDTEKFPESLNDLVKVEYVNRPVDFDGDPMAVLGSKFKIWEYEHEWRAIVPLDLAIRRKFLFAGRDRFVKMPSEAIVVIIMGARSNVRAVLKKLIWYGGWAGAPYIGRAVLNIDQYKMDIRPVIRNYGRDMPPCFADEQRSK